MKVFVPSLERIIASKKVAGREKGGIVLKVLSDMLKVVRERERSKSARKKCFDRDVSIIAGRMGG